MTSTEALQGMEVTRKGAKKSPAIARDVGISLPDLQQEWEKLSLSPTHCK